VQFAAGSWLPGGLVLLRTGSGCDVGDGAQGGGKLLRLTGKPPKLAFVAVARKLLTILNAIAREKTAWQA
jgi:transposase